MNSGAGVGLDALMKDKRGVIAMLDYVNFKGEGLGGGRSGWGLYRVLLEASRNQIQKLALNRFRAAAEEILRRRKDWAVYGRGWKNRLATLGDYVDSEAL